MAGLALRDEVERADAFYRFSVKCDRLTNMKIAAAARKAGMTVNSFVQHHFETILDEPAAPKLASFDAEAFDAVAFSKRHQVPILAARLWAELRRHADAAGTVQRFKTVLADDIGCDRATTVRLVDTLIDEGLLEVVRKGKVGSPAVYLVLGEG